MKLYKFSIFALALLTGAMASCSDDKDEYQVGAQSAGAYFSNKLNTTIVIAEGSTSTTVPVMRTETDADQTVALTVTDASGLFTVPSSVSFPSGQNTANINVVYDTANMEYDTPYEVTIQVAEADQTLYGNSTATFTFVVKSPVIELPTTTCDYVYNILFGGEADQGLPVTITYTEGQEWLKTYTIHNWGGEVDFAIEVNEQEVDEYGCYICHWKTFNTNVVYPDGDNRIPIYLSEYWPYADDDEKEEAYKASYFNPETGLFSLYCFYILEDGRAFSPGYDYCQLAGYPDYTVSVTYSGMFTDPKGKRTAIGSVTVGADADYAIVANILGDDVQQAISDMVSGAVETVTLGPGDAQKVEFPLAEGGKHTLVAITSGAGELQSLDYATYVIADGGGSEDDIDWEGWETLGWAPYCDGFVLAAFGYDPFEFVDGFYVEVQANEEYPGWIRLLNPYNALENMNQNTTRNAIIAINLQYPDMCYVPVQYTGFSVDAAQSGAPWGDDWYASDLLGYLLSAGEEADQAIAKVEQEDGFSTYEDGVISLSIPLIGGAEEFGWYPSGKGGYPVEIYLSDMVAPDQGKPALAKAKAHKSLAKAAPKKVRATYTKRELMMKANLVDHVDHNKVKKTLKLRRTLR